MSCGTDVGASGSTEVVRGLCLKCAMALSSSLPPDMERVLYSGWYGYWETIEAISEFPRCEDCPTYGIWESLAGSPMPRGLGQGCLDDANAYADTLFPHDFPSLSPSHDWTPKERAAFRVANNASKLISDERRAIIRSWPRCHTCPGTPAPVKPKSAAGLESRILDALAAHLTPMSTSDLVAVVKGLSNNNAKRELQPLVESGQIRVEARGPAKFYSLAKQ